MSEPKQKSRDLARLPAPVRQLREFLDVLDRADILKKLVGDLPGAIFGTQAPHPDIRKAQGEKHNG